MSALVMGLVWEMPESPEFGRAEKYILLAYADHADSNGRNIYPSVDLVSRKTFYEERSVQATTRRLQGLGLLVPDGQGPHGTNRFFIPIQHLADGGAKIAPVQNTMQKFAPEGIAPEGIAPKPSVVVKPFNTTTLADEKTSADIFKFYENEIGMLTPLARDAVNEWIDDADFPNQWILDAIRSAVVQNKRSWAYVAAILKNWKSKGKQDTRPSKKESNYAHSNSKPGTSKRTEQANPTDADRAAAERVKQRRALHVP
jgi:DnaD/phage-associated family protein